jgi:hypothetical protein
MLGNRLQTNNTQRVQIGLGRPIFTIALYVIVIWREFNCVRIPQSEANKSVNRWGNLHATGGVVPPSVFNLPSLCEHQIQLFTRLRCLLLHLNPEHFYRLKKEHKVSLEVNNPAKTHTYLDS